MGKIVIITLDEGSEHVLNKILDSIEAEKFSSWMFHQRRYCPSQTYPSIPMNVR